MKLISVIVAVHNSAPYLHQCVNSILIQSHENLEVILVDDGSTDESVYLCNYFKNIDNRVIVIHKKNEGLVSSRKAGIHAASGEYIFYVDGDDWLAQDYVKSYVAQIKNEQIDVVIAQHYKEFIGKIEKIENNIPCGLYKKNDTIKDIYSNLISDKIFFRHGIYTYSWGKMFKREVALDAQLNVPNNLHIGEDAAFTYPLFFKAESIKIFEYSGYYYRQRPNSILKVFQNHSVEVSQLITLFNYLKNELSYYNEGTDIIRQVYEYFFTLVIMRTGLFFNHEKIYEKLHLLDDIPKGSEICLYSAGSFGQKVFQNLQETKYFKVVAWFDEKYKEHNIMGLPVLPPSEITSFSYDYIIVAGLNPFHCRKVVELLSSYNVLSSKIKCISINRTKVPHFVDLINKEWESEL